MKRLTADEEHWYVDLSLEPSQMVFRKTVYLSNPADARKWSYVEVFRKTVYLSNPADARKWSYVDKDTKAMYEKKAKTKSKKKTTKK